MEMSNSYVDIRNNYMLLRRFPYLVQFILQLVFLYCHNLTLLFNSGFSESMDPSVNCKNFDEDYELNNTLRYYICTDRLMLTFDYKPMFTNPRTNISNSRPTSFRSINIISTGLLLPYLRRGQYILPRLFSSFALLPKPVQHKC